MTKHGPGGWAGLVLKVDLTSGSITRVPTSEYEPDKYLGGVGLNTKIFWDMGCPKVGAFDPESPLLVSVGPLTGLPGPFNRAEVCGIAPQSYPEELYSYSGFGGKWPSELKYAGYDGVLVVGRAQKPVYLSIQDEQICLEDAADLWGLDSFEAQRAIMKANPRASVLTMGKAGESLARNATLSNESGNTAGQGGFGAVMGSKNLKAISVRGTGTVRIAHPERYLRLVEGRKARGQWLAGGAQAWGRSPYFHGEAADEIEHKYRKKFCGSYGCPYQCIGFYDMPGVGKGQAMCASWFFARFFKDARTIWEGQIVSQRLGINHFDLLGIMGFMQEAVARGLLTAEEWRAAGLPPLPVFWGGEATEHEFLSALLNGIAEGTSPFSQSGARGFRKIIESVKSEKSRGKLLKLGEEMYPAYGYTSHYFGWLPLALTIAMDTRDSGDSTDAYLAFAGRGVDAIVEGVEAVSNLVGDMSRHFAVPAGSALFAHPPGGPKEAVYEGVEIQALWTEHNHCIENSLPMCNFVCLPDQMFDPPEMDIRVFMAEAFSAVTGVETDVEELWRKGERIWNLRRAVMVKREGRSRQSDTFPDAIFDTVWKDRDIMTDEPIDAQIDRERFEALKDRYYTLRGWDREKGRPTRPTLEALDMTDVADELERLHELGR